MSEFAPSSSTATPELDGDDLDAALEDAEVFDDGENDDSIDINNAVEETIDSEDNHLYLEGPGVTYTAEEGEWQMPEAYSEETREPQTLQELDVRENLQGSEGLKQRVREVAFNRISQLHEAKGYAEDGKDAVKQKYLGVKKERQQSKYEKYESKAQTSLFQRRREHFAMKAKWAKRNLNATGAKLTQLENKHKLHVEEKTNKVEIQPSKIDSLRIKRAVERRKELERRRNILLEKKLVANQEKRLKGEQAEAVHAGLSESGHQHLTEAILQARPIDEFRQSVKSILRAELNKRVSIYRANLQEQHDQKIQSKGSI